jgi:hypothetical protein
MDEKELIDGLRRLTLAEPRLGFDPDEVAGRAAKRRRTRRQLLATAAGTVVVVGMAVGTLLFVNAGASLPLVPGSTTTTTRTTPSTKVNGPDMSKQVARIRTHAQQVLPTLVPGAQDLRINAEQAYARDYVMAVIEYQDSAGPANFNLSVMGPDTAASGTFTFKETCDCEPPLSQQDGSKVYIERSAVSPATKRPAERHAAHYRTDGSIVSVYHDNSYGVAQAERAGIKDAKGEGKAGFRNRFPLTDQQIVALLTDPAFNVR